MSHLVTHPSTQFTCSQNNVSLVMSSVSKSRVQVPFPRFGSGFGYQKSQGFSRVLGSRLPDYITIHSWWVRVSKFGYHFSGSGFRVSEPITMLAHNSGQRSDSNVLGKTCDICLLLKPVSWVFIPYLKKGLFSDNLKKRNTHQHCNVLDRRSAIFD